MPHPHFPAVTLPHCQFLIVGKNGRSITTMDRNTDMDTLTLVDRTFHLSRARDVDVADIVPLLTDGPLGRTRESSSLSPYMDAFHRIDADPNHLLLIVREDSPTTGPAVATMQLTLLPGLSRGGATRLQIEAVRIGRRAQGIGLGTAVFDWAHTCGRRFGASLAQLTTDKSRGDAQRFYARLGYTASHEGLKLDLGD